MLNPSRYRILAIGKAKKNWIQSGFDLYLKRLPGLTITALRDSDLKKEAQSIRSSISLLSKDLIKERVSIKNKILQASALIK